MNEPKPQKICPILTAGLQGVVNDVWYCLRGECAWYYSLGVWTDGRWVETGGRCAILNTGSNGEI